MMDRKSRFTVVLAVVGILLGAATVQASQTAKHQAEELRRAKLSLIEAIIAAEKESGGKEASGNYMIDNTRLVSEFGVQYRPYRDRVLQIINDIRRDNRLPPIG